jgi:hypothetical protein
MRSKGNRVRSSRRKIGHKFTAGLKRPGMNVGRKRRRDVSVVCRTSFGRYSRRATHEPRKPSFP